MAYHRHLIDLLWDVVPANTAPATSAQPRLCLQWHRGEDGSLRSRWTHVRD